MADSADWFSGINPEDLFTNLRWKKIWENEIFCQNGKIIFPFLQKITRFEKNIDSFSTCSHDFFPVYTCTLSIGLTFTHNKMSITHNLRTVFRN